MQAKKRYILVFLSCAFLALCYFGGYRLKHLDLRRNRDWPVLECFIDNEEVMDKPIWSPRKMDRDSSRVSMSRELCRMETCFDFTKCDGSFKVYVYPTDDSAPLSSTYRKILNVITESR